MNKDGTPRKKHSRRFLNKREGMAAIEWSVTSDMHKPWKRPDGKTVKVTPDISADFTITDCNRQVSLEFSVYDKGDLRAKLEEVRLLEDDIDSFAYALEEAINWAEGEWPA